MKITEVRKIAKNMRINIKNKDGELRTKESLLRSINRKMIKGGGNVENNALTNQEKLIKKKCERYVELYELGSVEDLVSIVKNYSDLYRILFIYSWEYECYNVLLNRLWEKEEIDKFVKARLDSLLSEYNSTKVNNRENMLKNYFHKIYKIFQIQAYYKIDAIGNRIIESGKEFATNQNIQDFSDLNKTFKTNLVKTLLDVLKKSDEQIEADFIEIQPKSDNKLSNNLTNILNNKVKKHARCLHNKVDTKVYFMKKLIDELKPINVIRPAGEEAFLRDCNQ